MSDTNSIDTNEADWTFDPRPLTEAEQAEQAARYARKQQEKVYAADRHAVSEVLCAAIQNWDDDIEPGEIDAIHTACETSPLLRRIIIQWAGVESARSVQADIDRGIAQGTRERDFMRWAADQRRDAQ